MTGCSCECCTPAVLLSLCCPFQSATEQRGLLIPLKLNLLSVPGGCSALRRGVPTWRPPSGASWHRPCRRACCCSRYWRTWMLQQRCGPCGACAVLGLGPCLTCLAACACLPTRLPPCAGSLTVSESGCSCAVSVAALRPALNPPAPCCACCLLLWMPWMRLRWPPTTRRCLPRCCARWTCAGAAPLPCSPRGVWQKLEPGLPAAHTFAVPMH